MTKYTIFPKLVKVLEVYDDWQWSRKIKRVIGRRLIIGTYYVAEHDKTIGLDMTSPKPIASFLKANSPMIATSQRPPNPATSPIAERMRAVCQLKVKCSVGIRTLRMTPAMMPPIVTRSGRM